MGGIEGGGGVILTQLKGRISRIEWGRCVDRELECEVLAQSEVSGLETLLGDDRFQD